MKKKRQTRLSRQTFTAVLAELQSGPSTATTLARVSGMSHRYVCLLLRTMRAGGVIHVAGWEKDALGREAVKVWALGYGRDAKRRTKTREAVNRAYRTRRQMDPLKGTPFYGLTVAAAG